MTTKRNNLQKVVDSVTILSTTIFMKEVFKMDNSKYKYILIRKTDSETFIHGFKNKSVMFECANNWVSWGCSIEIMEYPVYIYSDRYEELRNSGIEIIDYMSF